MPKKVVVAKLGDCEILVVNTWFSGLTLLVNDEEIRKYDNLVAVSKDKPIISEHVEINGSKRLIEVFVHAVFTVKIKICVDGAHISGDYF